MPQRTDIRALIGQLDLIIEQSGHLETRFADELAKVHPDLRASARNLLAYMAMRQRDIRDLQQQLSELGLSSLGRAERDVLGSIHAVRGALCRFVDDDNRCPDGQMRSFEQSAQRSKMHVDDLLGQTLHDRDARIMVTLPSEAADDAELVYELIVAGMDIARINSAHDDESVWLRLVDNFRRASAKAGRECKITMDLAGPKIRTGPLRPGPGVIRIRPKRDARGRVIAPRRLRFVADDSSGLLCGNNTVPVPRTCIEDARVGDRIKFKDARGKKRALKVVQKDADELRLECFRTAYLAAGTKLKLHSATGDTVTTFRVGDLPPSEEPIILSEGDTLLLHSQQIPGEPTQLGADGSVLESAHIACSQPDVLRSIAPGDPVRLNDGKIEGIVKSIDAEGLDIQITRAKPTGSRLRSDKGINFPGSNIIQEGLTDSDKTNLKFIAQHADAVSLSFVRAPADILALQLELKKYPQRQIGIIVKVETVKAFKDLPRLLLAAMCHYPVGVMIARGDLAVESGWERLAEIQEEILWLCEAAHVPVIWATQVLEQKTKSGQPSRAEITDAAMSQRADCVMLNKGPHILAAIRMLDDILRRMQSHQHKKTSQLRKLDVSTML
jgi:pyruvate kinase